MRRIMKISNYMLAFFLLSLLPFLRIANDPNKTVSVFNEPYIYELDFKMKDGSSIRSIISEQHTIDTPIAELNDYTLREVFEGGNLILNHDFSNGKTSWIDPFNRLNVIDGVANLLSDEASQFYGQVINMPIGNFFVRFDFQSNKTLNAVHIRMNDTPFTYVLQPLLSTSAILTPRSYDVDVTVATDYLYRIIDFNGSEWQTSQSDNHYVINKTSLGISSLTVEEMDYYYSLYNALKNIEPLPNEVENGFYTNEDVVIYITPLIANKQHSPMYNTTFDLMTDEQIKLQMDYWVNVYQEHINDLEFSMFNNMLSDNNPDNYTPFELGKLYVEEGLLQFIPRNTVVREGQHRLTKFTWPFLDNTLYLFSEGMDLLFIPVYNVLAENIPILPTIKDTNTSIEEGVAEFYMGKSIIGSNLQEYTLNYYDNYTGSNWIVEDVAGWVEYKVVFNSYPGIYNLSNTIFNGRFTRSSLDLQIIDDYTVVNLYYDSLNDLYIFQLRPDGFLNKRVYKYATDLELKEFFMIS